MSGIAWGAHELATFLLFFDAIRPEQRTRVLTWYNLANATAVVIGTSLGALLLRDQGLNFAGYAVLFWISASARALTLPLLAWLPDAHAGGGGSGHGHPRRATVGRLDRSPGPRRPARQPARAARAGGPG